MKFSKLIKMAVSSVLANKVRSFLTMLGIIIGISSVIALVGMGQGTKQDVASKISSLGTNLITVNIMGRRSVTVTTAELNELKKKPGIKDIAPSASQGSVTVKSGSSSKSTSTSIEGCVPSSATIRKLGVSNGRFINQDDVDSRYRVAVIGTDAADTLFGSTDIIGEEINVNGSIFSIVGVLATQGGSGQDSPDDKIIIPLSVAQRLFKISTIRTFYVEAEDENSVSEAKAYLQIFLNNKFSSDSTGSTNYRIMDQSTLLATATSTSDSMTTMLSGVAAISLLVGGIGIMNIMLVSVIERTREIGIRKAIGAKRMTILIQFLLESAGISTFGGILGVLGGYVAAYVMKTFFNTSVVISTNVVLMAFLFSVVVGVVFGVYPANKASKLSPIEALRFE
ncbi:ABC transporter permease [Clostridium magnum]|uniref:Macrolide export ATP-binding/permease protein MacB n=1 Tax=Clostridium magnum DSM 2767 TaxID=1121326 RepID=A0A162R9K7_9CLOT|nr:ABC transporter permease [Clostridium magnum]KZL89594.1 macrolide export ATP-binding/permease protein MacB [Clostridium magnum DSM 2767]SHH73551.1 putative ABC transport system permease protein [Clostridium magnum DSM 2767]